MERFCYRISDSDSNLFSKSTPKAAPSKIWFTDGSVEGRYYEGRYAKNGRYYDLKTIPIKRKSRNAIILGNDIIYKL